MSNSPCMGCDKRSPACHGRCPDYIEWKEKHTGRDRTCNFKLDQMRIQHIMANKKRRHTP